MGEGVPSGSSGFVADSQTRSVKAQADSLYVKSILNSQLTPEQLNQLKLGHEVNGQSLEAYTQAKLDQLAQNPDAESFMRAYIDDLVSNGTLTQTQADQFIAENDLNEAFIELFNGNSSTRYASRGILSPVTDALKDGLVNILDTDAGNAVTGATFDLVLESDGVTTFMLDQARNSETITQVMIDALGNNWELTEKMCPMLSENREFGEKFAALAYERPIMAKFFFENVDGNLYSCLTDAMALSKTTDGMDETVEYPTTVYMGKLMSNYAPTFLVAPNSDSSNSSGYGRRDQFVNLMFNTGEVVTDAGDEDATTFANHGDGNELANEKFFNVMFSTPDSTNDFVKAMAQLSEVKQKMFMDEIFLGQSPSGSEVDTYQSYFNNLAIGAGMYKGVSEYGVGSYLGAFWGFFKLIPSDRYVDYTKAFMNTGYAYMAYQGIDPWSGVKAKVIEAWNNYRSETIAQDETAIAASEATTRYAVRDVAAESDTTTETTEEPTTIEKIKQYINEFLAQYQEKIGALQAQVKEAVAAYIDGLKQKLLVIATGAYHSKAEEASSFIVQQIDGIKAMIQAALNAKIAALNGTLDENGITIEIPEVTLPDFDQSQAWNFVHNGLIDTSDVYYPEVTLAIQPTLDIENKRIMPAQEGINAYFADTQSNVHVPKWLLVSKDWLAQGQAYTADQFNFNTGEMRLYVVSDEVNAPTEEGVKMLPKSKVLIEDADGNVTEKGIYRLTATTPEAVAGLLNQLSANYDQIAIDASHVVMATISETAASTAESEDTTTPAE